MSEQNHNLRLMLVLIVAALAILLAMCSCSTKTLTEYVTIHDTLEVHHSDTLKEVRIVHHTDTVLQKEIHTYTINNVGDTIKEIHHYTDVQRTIVVDSTDRYKAVVDSLKQALIKEQNKEKTIIKKPSLWKQFMWLCTGIAIAAIAGIAVWVLRKKT